MNNLDFYVKWIATVFALAGAACASVNLYPAGPILMNVGAVLWLWVAILWREWSLIVINAALLVIYTAGLAIKLL